MISDTNGFDDKSFNQTSLKGMTDAKSELGFETAQVQSRAATDYAKNIQSMVDAKCNMIVTVGFLLGDDTLPRRRRILTSSSPSSTTTIRRPTRRPRTSSRWSSIRPSRVS